MTSRETFSTRSELGRLVPEGGLWVELGVARGDFAVEVLRRNAQLRYLGIDRWSDHHDAVEAGVAGQALRPYLPRGILQRSTFAAAAGYMPDECCDVVYVDGYAHTGQAEGATLEQWWPKVRRGGILAGHDYDLAKWPLTYKAVNYFAGSRGLKVEVIEEATGYASWWIRRPLVDRRLVTGRCVLVGNGPSVQGRGLGPVIDACDTVVRFNDFVTAGFEADTGSKVSLWSCYGENAQRVRPQRPGRVIYMHGATAQPEWYEPEEVWRVRLEFYHELQERVRARSKLPAEQRAKLLPSAGLVVLCWLLERHAVPLVQLVGFDHFERANVGGRHHYWRAGKYSSPSEHDGVVEGEMVRELRATGRVGELNNETKGI